MKEFLRLIKGVFYTHYQTLYFRKEIKLNMFKTSFYYEVQKCETAIDALLVSSSMINDGWEEIPKELYIQNRKFK